MRAQGGDGHPQAEGRGPRRNGPADTLTLDFRPPALWGNRWLQLKPHLRNDVTAAPGARPRANCLQVSAS